MSLIQEVRKLAEEYPDTVYPEDKCRYTIGKCGRGTGCIIGQAMQACEFQYLAFKTDQGGSSSVRNLFDDMKITNVNDKEWLRVVQERQDYGDTWTKSIEYADICLGIIN